jgi:hypothetical protein
MSWMKVRVALGRRDQVWFHGRRLVHREPPEPSPSPVLGGHAGASGGALGDQSFPLTLILATAAEASGGASNHTERQRVSMRAVRWVKDDRQKWIERPMISHFSEVLS